MKRSFGFVMLIFGFLVVAPSFAADNAKERGSDPPEAYVPKTLDGRAVRTCFVDVSGKTTCGPDVGGPGDDSGRLGFGMMMISGINDSRDKRWTRAVYGVTDKSCTKGGTSVAAMLTDAGVAAKVRTEVDALAKSQPKVMEKAKVDKLDIYVSDMQQDCVMVFGYPSDRMVLLAMAAKNDRESARKAIGSMLAAAKTR